MEPRFRLAVLHTHPIQYLAPMYQKIGKREDIDLTVFYCSRQGIEPGFVDAGFGRSLLWDRNLLAGYRSRFLPAPFGDRGVRGFWSIFNPALLRELRKGRFDALIVHGHSYGTDLIGFLGAKLLGTPVFLRCETQLRLHRSRRRRLLRRLLIGPLYRWADACLYIGRLNRDFYLSLCIPEERLFPVPYAVDNELFAAAARTPDGAGALRRECGLPADMPVVLYSSKLQRRKHPAHLLEAYERLRAEGVRCALVYVGDGEEKPRLLDAVRQRAIPDVHFLGFRNQGELPACYAAATVFVLPSENEPWGLVTNEALCAGTPVVTTREVGAAADLVEPGVTGFLFDTGDVGALAGHLRRIVTDPALRARMSQAARARMAAWSYDQCIEGILRALAARGRGARARR